MFYTSVPRYVDHLIQRTVHTNQLQLSVITLIITASVVLCYRSADQVAVPSFHHLRTEDMPGREAMRAGVVFWPSTSLPTGRLFQKATRCYFSSILSGAVSWRARIPMQVRSHWNANHKYKRMFTGNAWNCCFRLNTYICRQFGETRSTKLSDRRAILPSRHYVTYSLTHAPRKGLYGMQDKKIVINILVQGLMTYSKGACS